MEKKKYISILSVIACFMVVLLHHNGTMYEFGLDARWFSANAVECICYCAVPIFLMISGATLIDYRKRYDTKTFFKKRIYKTVIPYMVWVVLAVIYKLVIGEFVIADLASIKFWFEVFFFHYSMFFVYAFFMYLFAIYLSIPVISLIPEEKRKKVYGYMIILYLILGTGLPFFSQLVGYRYDSKLTIAVVGGYLVYPLIGYWIDNYEIKFKSRIIIYIIGALSILVHYFGNYYLGKKTWTYDETFGDYLNVFVIIYSAAIFMFFKYVTRSDKSRYLTRFMEIITTPFTKLTFGIYLIHVYIYDFILHFSGISESSLIWRFLMPIFVFIVSALIVFLVQKIPILKRILPS